MNSPADRTTTQSETPDAQLHSQGVTLFESGQIEEASESLRKALHHNPERADTLYMLGLCFHKTGRYETAIDLYQNAGTLSPNFTDCWINLARTRLKLSRFKEALSAVRQARKHAQDPHNPELIQLLLQAIAPVENPDIGPRLVEEVTRCFETPEVPCDRLVHTAQKMLRHQPVVKSLLEHYSPAGFRDFEALRSDASLHWVVLSHPLFAALMRDYIVWDIELEKLFQALRLHMLRKAAEHPLNEGMLWPQALNFLAALAQQCFMGEYVYDVSAQEAELLPALRARIENTETLDAYDLSIYACYEPLHDLAHSESIAQNEALMKIPAIASLIRMQILEPAEETRLKTELKSFTSIDDEVSLLVKEQYEANPYPRWASTGVEASSSLRGILKFQFPYIDDADLPSENSTPEVLIAGCGTGRQSIGNALLIPQANYTAVDITAASLAYAQRKTQEMGLENIRYGLGDILKLDELDKRFDMVQCGGVLHHMRDPMAGWQVLSDILKPGGYMVIALYSEIARRAVVAARDYISRQGLDDTPEGIREMRRYIKSLPDDHPMKSLIVHRDFFSLSECRDLIFHVQEHRFTALDLKKSIEALGLKFLGFQQPMPQGVMAQYRARYPQDPYGLELENWHEFELKHPETFVGMYQFWLRKPDDV